ncbi:RecX family transcriptional regulator [Pedobacter sp. SD-b]|uniref:Regulatory protein RecX n=1 Tax=Pedobacter segetis TaxID=2793069 RepID=A0ABS1BKR4_9SPHI|nr:regulatory protein RecX [Pedobacter segetis]MBK0383473.1 RecX family transcriptional regulator [Pedobacter segetis]
MQQKTTIPLGFKSALQKAEAYCAYQERSQYEVRGKLISMGIYGDELELIILKLLETNFLNEERFANTYARGKMRINSWGKNKIKQGLKLKQVSLPLIKKALQNLDGEEYLEKLIGVLEKKATTIKENERFKRNYKLSQYAMSRGFEQDLIFFVLNDREL